jgi:hypothetical protein
MNEEYIFFIDLFHLCKMNNSYDKIFLVFQIMTSSFQNPNDSTHLVDQHMTEESENFLYGISWLAFPVFNGLKMNVGRHLEHLKAPPMQRPPFEEDKSIEDFLF